MTRRLLILALALPVLAGCGGGDGSAPDDFVADANRICREGESKIQEVTREEQEAAGNPRVARGAAAGGGDRAGAHGGGLRAVHGAPAGARAATRPRGELDELPRRRRARLRPHPGAGRGDARRRPGEADRRCPRTSRRSRARRGRSRRTTGSTTACPTRVVSPAAARRRCRANHCSYCSGVQPRSPTSSCHTSGWLSVQRMSVARSTSRPGASACLVVAGSRRSRAGWRGSRSGSGSTARRCRGRPAPAPRMTLSTPAMRGLTRRELRALQPQLALGVRLLDDLAVPLPLGHGRLVAGRRAGAWFHSARSRPLLVSKATYTVLSATPASAAIASIVVAA